MTLPAAAAAAGAGAACCHWMVAGANRYMRADRERKRRKIERDIVKKRL
jgi:hypothetical protein